MFHMDEEEKETENSSISYSFRARFFWFLGGLYQTSTAPSECHGRVWFFEYALNQKSACSRVKP